MRLFQIGIDDRREIEMPYASNEDGIIIDFLPNSDRPAFPYRIVLPVISAVRDRTATAPSPWHVALGGLGRSSPARGMATLPIDRDIERGLATH